MGITVGECSARCMAELEAIASEFPTIHLFVDSGAFSEVRFGADGPRTVRPIDDGEWARILAAYSRLAEWFGPRLHVVAPDKVGDQAETLNRLARYRPELLELLERGVRVMVPIQAGAEPIGPFHDRVAETLDDPRWIPAFPLKKGALRPDEVLEFIRERRPTDLHLLGVGLNPRNPQLRELAWRIAALVPGATVTRDSVLLRAKVGRQGGGPDPRRPLTRLKDEHAARGVGAAARGREPGLPDLTEIGGLEWCRGACAAELAAKLRLDGAELEAFMSDPGAWYGSVDPGDRRVVQAVEDAALRFYRRALSDPIEERAVRDLVLGRDVVLTDADAAELLDALNAVPETFDRWADRAAATDAELVGAFVAEGGDRARRLALGDRATLARKLRKLFDV